MTHTHTHTRRQTHTYIHPHTHARTHTHTHAHIHTHTHTFMHTHTPVWGRLVRRTPFVFVYMYIYACVRVHIYKYIIRTHRSTYMLVCRLANVSRDATHLFYRSSSKKETYNHWLFCGKRPATEGILCIFATLYHATPHTYFIGYFSQKRPIISGDLAGKDHILYVHTDLHIYWYAIRRTPFIPVSRYIYFCGYSKYTCASRATYIYSGYKRARMRADRHIHI